MWYSSSCNKNNNKKELNFCSYVWSAIHTIKTALEVVSLFSLLKWYDERVISIKFWTSNWHLLDIGGNLSTEAKSTMHYGLSQSHKVLSVSLEAVSQYQTSYYNLHTHNFGTRTISQPWRKQWWKKKGNYLLVTLCLAYSNVIFFQARKMHADTKLGQTTVTPHTQPVILPSPILKARFGKFVFYKEKKPEVRSELDGCWAGDKHQATAPSGTVKCVTWQLSSSNGPQRHCLLFSVIFPDHLG